jgi:protein-S-isoprenylcysteine O-methyltransferase Ste14
VSSLNAQEQVQTQPSRDNSLATPAARHFAASAFGAIFWLVFAVINIRYSIESGRVIGLGVGLLGLWSAVLFCVRRPPALVSRSAPIWIAAYFGTFGASLLRPGGPHFAWLDAGALVLQGIGIVIGCLSLAALGRSLGLVPAHRGLVTSGAYGVLRHPLYASYVFVDLGYLMQSPRLWNVAVLTAVWACQVVRIVSEEKLLGTDAAYREYAQQTRWRLIPRVW